MLVVGPALLVSREHAGREFESLRPGQQYQALTVLRCGKLLLVFGT